MNNQLLALVKTLKVSEAVSKEFLRSDYEKSLKGETAPTCGTPNCYGCGSFAKGCTSGELSNRARSRLTVENDDRTYTPRDLFPVCEELGLPLVYDVHHHRCLGDGLDVETATKRSILTWNREPLFHISSPREGWRADNPRFHSDYINLRDFPTLWDDMEITVEVEAKAKELAVRKLIRALARRAKRKSFQR